MNTIPHLPAVVDIGAVPIVDTASFTQSVREYLSEGNTRHCLHYVAVPHGSDLRCIAILASDKEHHCHGISHVVSPGATVPSISQHHPQMHIFERDLWERHGIEFEGHPWLKPVRFPVGAAHGRGIDDYPFFRIDGGEIHEVGVGPIHAGVIEPGHFRFQCTGEDVLHLEIMLGYQHRDVEGELVRSGNPRKRSVIVESIAGDTTIGHAWAHAMAVEKLAGVTCDSVSEIERAIALELERMAIHMGDLGALSLDVAWQLGSSYFGALRTPLINFFQLWCGNRFGKGLIRPGANRFRLTSELRSSMRTTLDEVEKKFTALVNKMFSLPSVNNRFEKAGIVTHEQVALIGAVGMSARMSGLARDIRHSHPHGVYSSREYASIVEHGGDVLSRALVRRREIDASIAIIRDLLTELDGMLSTSPVPNVVSLAPNSIAISAVEAWRGELVHVVVTDATGNISTYRVKDPSMHNWFVLALSVRNNEISDFPICNKSFDLSYCGHDL
ncbi:MAG: NADH-quinone oxidoreductase subunit C [Candidatus Kapabacteria bacterium]|nr:NADH-quinone oxidoreductase subunit C [Candidatus Kapabacteria bacterium]